MAILRRVAKLTQRMYGIRSHAIDQEVLEVFAINTNNTNQSARISISANNGSWRLKKKSDHRKLRRSCSAKRGSRRDRSFIFETQTL